MAISNAGLAAAVTALGTTWYIALGTDDTVFAKTQTALVAETSSYDLGRAAATVAVTTTTAANDTIQCTKTFTSTGSITIKEAGLFSASSGPTMYGRKVLSPTRALTANDQSTIIYKLIFTN